MCCIYHSPRNGFATVARINCVSAWVTWGSISKFSPFAVPGFWSVTVLAKKSTSPKWFVLKGRIPQQLNAILTEIKNLNDWYRLINSTELQFIIINFSQIVRYQLGIALLRCVLVKIAWSEMKMANSSIRIFGSCKPLHVCKILQKKSSNYKRNIGLKVAVFDCYAVEWFNSSMWFALQKVWIGFTLFWKCSNHLTKSSTFMYSDPETNTSKSAVRRLLSSGFSQFCWHMVLRCPEAANSRDNYSLVRWRYLQNDSLSLIRNYFWCIAWNILFMSASSSINIENLLWTKLELHQNSS